jgi:hypothetical protein
LNANSRRNRKVGHAIKPCIGLLLNVEFLCCLCVATPPKSMRNLFEYDACTSSSLYLPFCTDNMRKILYTPCTLGSEGYDKLGAPEYALISNG